jgi:UPF0716 protein FxsA
MWVMSLLKWALIGLIGLPAAELAAFVVVAVAIGWFKATLLLVATSLAGVALLRRSGRDNLAHLREALSQEGLSAIHLERPAVAAMTGGILLVVPGFITDLLGAALFVPPARRWLTRKLGELARAGRGPRDETVIDLAPGEWRRIESGRRQRRPRRPSNANDAPNDAASRR